jgi:hypothetical protein
MATQGAARLPFAPGRAPCQKGPGAPGQRAVPRVRGAGHIRGGARERAECGLPKR